MGVAWKINEEEFFKPITIVSQLKLRASYGVTGNSNIPLQLSTVWKGESNNIVYSLGDSKTFVQGATVNSAIDLNTRWETTNQFDIGADVAFFDDRLTLSVGYYDRRNKDLLLDVPLPLSTGIGGPYDINGKILKNAASASNKGVEVSLGYQGNAGDFRYSFTSNLAYNKNEVVSLGEGKPITGGGVNGGSQATLTDIGHPIGSFYGYIVDHVAVDQADVNAYNASAQSKTGDASAVYQTGLLPGDIIFKDIDGDGQVTTKDQTFIGSPIPKWNYGANINLGYKQFDMMISLYGVGGVEIWNDLKYWTEGTSRPFNSSTALLSRWRTEGDRSEYPKAGQNATSSQNLRPSTRFVENGSYLRFRNITVGYTLPLLDKRVFTNARIYATVQNLFTITDYKGYDPEIGAQDPNSIQSFIFARGIDGGQYPQPRTFMLGVQIGF